MKEAVLEEGKKDPRTASIFRDTDLTTKLLSDEEQRKAIEIEYEASPLQGYEPPQLG